ncbi:hypothetical protein GQX74_011176 [Glossina fuscipes]|nr:hypothetical protein GQX74_011176 [Glossina fuscipes]
MKRLAFSLMLIATACAVISKDVEKAGIRSHKGIDRVHKVKELDIDVDRCVLSDHFNIYKFSDDLEKSSNGDLGGLHQVLESYVEKDNYVINLNLILRYNLTGILSGYAAYKIIRFVTFASTGKNLVAIMPWCAAAEH